MNRNNPREFDLDIKIMALVSEVWSVALDFTKLTSSDLALSSSHLTSAGVLKRCDFEIYLGTRYFPSLPLKLCWLTREGFHICI